MNFHLGILHSQRDTAVPQFRSRVRSLLLAFFFVIGFSVLLTGCALQKTTPRSFCENLPSYISRIEDYLQQDIQHTPSCNTYNQSEYKELLLSVLQKEATPKELEYEMYALKHLGLVPQTYNYIECIYPAFIRLASAFYIPSNKALVLPNWSEPLPQIVIHELVHHFQNEQLDLTKNNKLRGLFHDSALSLGALLEGDADLVSKKLVQSYPQVFMPDTDLQYEFQPLELNNQECQMPSLLESLFIAQYQKGLRFWEKLYLLKPNLVRNTVLQSLPSETQYILHPERSLDDNSSKNICDRHNSAYSRSLGELIIRTTLSQFMSITESERIADGLQHDCFMLEPDGQIRWKSTWESEEDAAEFFHALETFKKHQGIILNGTAHQEGNNVLYMATGTQNDLGRL